MANTRSTVRDERELVADLQQLTQHQGVQRDDLAQFFFGNKLERLNSYWKLKTASDSHAVRGRVVGLLNRHISGLYPRRGTLPISDKDKVSVYHLIVRVGFNIGELATRLRADNRTKRLEWVSEKLSKNAPISARSCRRHLDDAIRQIARQLITGGMPAPDVPLSADDQVIVKSTESFIARFPLAHLLQMSGELEYAVNRARDSCESAKRAVYTFDVLLALLEMPSGRARACLDEVESGLSDEVVQGLRAMPDPMKPARPFYPFKWHKREEMALAWQYALAKTRREATELDVMLAILDGSSETNLWLQRYPLQESHAQVRAVVAQRGSEPIDPGISPVPD